MAKSKNKQLEETKIIKSYSFQLPLLKTYTISNITIIIVTGY